MGEKLGKKEKKGAAEWLVAFQKLQAVALIGLAAVTGSTTLWAAAAVDSTVGVVADAELKKWKKKKGKA